MALAEWLEIAAFDAQGDRAQATRQTLALLDLDRHDIELYKQLAGRLADDKDQAERAATTIVEAAPHEAAHHQALAEFRQEQGRWPDAIDLWKHVARLDALDPNGLIKLAEAQIHERRWQDARDTVARLGKTEWPARFGDLRGATLRLQRAIPHSP